MYLDHGGTNNCEEPVIFILHASLQVSLAQFQGGSQKINYPSVTDQLSLDQI